MKKIISLLLTFVILISSLPDSMLSVKAASSSKYVETIGENTPLRYDYGGDNTIVAKVLERGTVMTVTDSAKTWVFWPFKYNTWLKIEIEPNCTDDGNADEYWVFGGNTTEHIHCYAFGSCWSKGCPYNMMGEVLENKEFNLEVTSKKAVIREAPSVWAEKKKTVNKGGIVTAVCSVRNNSGNVWYKLEGDDSNYIYSGDVKTASEKKIIAQSNTIKNANKNESSSGSDNSSGTGNGSGSTTTSVNKNPVIEESKDEILSNFITYNPPKLCMHIYPPTMSGKCINCNEKYELEIHKLSETQYPGNDNLVEYKEPYTTSEKSGVVYSNDDKILLIGKVKNAFGETWYQTETGWINTVSKRELERVELKQKNYTFLSLTDVKIEYSYQPADAIVKDVTFVSENPNIATVNSDGIVTPKSSGQTRILCKAYTDDTNFIPFNLSVNIPKSLFEKDLEEWTYNNTKYEHDLALECVEYAALAYTDVSYIANADGTVSLKKCKGTTKPENLVQILRARGFIDVDLNDCYNFGDKATEYNSPITIAHKKYKYNGSQKDVVFVIATGSAGRPGWQGNMKMTGGSYKELDEHETFKAAATDAKDKLNQYIKTSGIDKPIVVVTGHSRGAAMGNILAANLMSSGNLYEEIYAYLFATPNTTKTPIKYPNIFNICNELDFVAHIPLSDGGWGYKKNGNTFVFNTNLLKEDSKGNFSKILTKEYGSLSFDWQFMSLPELKEYMIGKWPNVKEYYKKRECRWTVGVGGYEEELRNYVSAYDYFYGGLGLAAAGKLNGVTNMLNHIGHGVCEYTTLTLFFAANKALVPAFEDNHVIQTYHAAVLNDHLWEQDSDKGSLFSETDENMASLFLENCTNIDEIEREELYYFFTSDDNALMLEEAGWNVDDVSTWTGIECNSNGNVTKIDLSYMNLTGWFDATVFPYLTDLNLDGNSISLLAVGGCENLQTLSCLDNNITALSVNSCPNLVNLNCAFNEITTLDLNGMSNLVELNCSGNKISSLNLNGATSLMTARCVYNNISTLDLSTNTSLNTVFLGSNNIVEEANSELVSQMNQISLNGGSADIGIQKYNEAYSFNEDELACLSEFAGLSLNQSALEWDMDNPYTWQGIEWKICGGEYRVTGVNLDGLDVEGELQLPQAEYVESISCNNTSISSLNLLGCSSLKSIECDNSNLYELEIQGCSNLEQISCNDNFLEVEIVESSLNQAGLNTGIATLENQNINADISEFNSDEITELLSLLNQAENYEALGWSDEFPGQWDGITWTVYDGEYRVRILDLSNKSISGKLNLEKFVYLESFDLSGTELDEVWLSSSIATIPEKAFYNSSIERIYLNEGITRIEDSAFAYCDHLMTIVIPDSIVRIDDKVFYGCSSLQDVVFIGNEPYYVGNDVFTDTSNSLCISIFEDTQWDYEKGLLAEMFYTSYAEDIFMITNNVQLQADDYYSMENCYAGDDVEIIIVSRKEFENASCVLAVYDERGKMAEVKMENNISTSNYMTIVEFEDVNLQYVGIESARIKALLLQNIDSIKPLTDCLEKVYLKPL